MDPVAGAICTAAGCCAVRSVPRRGDLPRFPVSPRALSTSRGLHRSRGQWAASHILHFGIDMRGVYGKRAPNTEVHGAGLRGWLGPPRLGAWPPAPVWAGAGAVVPPTMGAAEVTGNA